MKGDFSSSKRRIVGIKISSDLSGGLSDKQSLFFISLGTDAGSHAHYLWPTKKLSKKERIRGNIHINSWMHLKLEVKKVGLRFSYHITAFKVCCFLRLQLLNQLLSFFERQGHLRNLIETMNFLPRKAQIMTILPCWNLCSELYLSWMTHAGHNIQNLWYILRLWA